MRKRSRPFSEERINAALFTDSPSSHVVRERSEEAAGTEDQTQAARLSHHPAPLAVLPEASPDSCPGRGTGHQSPAVGGPARGERRPAPRSAVAAWKPGRSSPPGASSCRSRWERRRRGRAGPAGWNLRAGTPGGDAGACGPGRFLRAPLAQPSARHGLLGEKHPPSPFLPLPGCHPVITPTHFLQLCFTDDKHLWFIVLGELQT